MNLNDYIRASKLKASEFAQSIGVSPAYLYQMATGRRPFPPHLVKQIKSLTGGQVTEQNLRPADWHLIWPELVAPAKPTDGWTGSDRRITDRRSKVRRTDDRRAS